VYDYLMMTTNTTNNKVPTAWSAAWVPYIQVQ
jgi:hypothetical protein